MKKFSGIACLTLTVLLGSAGTSWGADYEKGRAATQSGDFATALREFRPLAEKGDARAQSGLGWMYANGFGVPQDYKTAMKWFSLAAEQGFADAQYSLGVMYGLGQGVLQDNIYAHMWWNIAAVSGYKKASANRDIIAKEMTPAQIEKAEQLAQECVRKEYKGC